MAHTAAVCSGAAAVSTARPRCPQPPTRCQRCINASAMGTGGACRRRRWRCAAAADDEPGAGSSSVPDTLPVAGLDSDWRRFRAALVASSKAAGSEGGAGGAAGSDPEWAHPLPQPEHGCLLLANPLMFATSQTYFHMSAILIWAHDERGSAGLILNRPTEFTVSHFGQGAGFLTPEFDSARLHLGGDVGSDTVHLLHGFPGLPQATEIIPGVYLGGWDAAKRGIVEGRYSPDQFKVLSRYAGWGPGQLEAECARGVWLPVSASRHAVLRRTEGGSGATDLWHHIAQLAGGDLAALSREVLGVADPDISRAAGGNYTPKEGEESEGGGGGGGGALQRQPRRRGRLPEADYRDGDGI